MTPPCQNRKVLAVEMLEERTNPTITFGSGTGYTLGGNTQGVALGDLTGNGEQDLAVDSGGSGVQILLNKGNGQFTVASNPGLGFGPVQIGDITGDGIPDLVVGSVEGESLTVAPGNGDGTFGTPITNSLRAPAFAVALADFTGDGNLDVAVSDGGVGILLNNAGSLGQLINYDTGAGGIDSEGSMAIGDFNGDGKLDIALGGYSTNRIDILLNNGNGTFTTSTTSYPIPNHAGSLIAGDFYNDGHLDLAVAYAGGSGFGILKGNGDGTFQPVVTHSVGAVGELAAAEFDLDGNLDLAAIIPNSGSMEVFPGNGAGGFGTPIIVGGGNNSAGIAVGDVSGDGLDDLIDTTTDSPGGVEVVPNTSKVLSSFTLSAPANVTAGTPFSVTVTAKDQFGNTLTSYAGTVHFTSSDGQAVLPANATLTNGVGTFQVTLKTGGSQSITVADAIRTTVSDSATTTVAAGALAGFNVTGPATATAGVATSVTVTAEDAYGNPVSSYTGTVHFSSSDPQAVLPANSTLTAGTGTFSTTFKTSGSQTISVVDTTMGSLIGSSDSIAVYAGTATHFTLSAPGSTTAGAAFNVTVTAIDGFNNIATGYTGTIHFTSTDPQAVLPADTTLTTGTGTFSATLKTAGSQTLTATDTVTSTITGTTASITVGAGATSLLSLSAPGSATAGGGFSYTVTAEDAYGNITTGYTGTVHFTSTDNRAVLPANTTLTAGTGTFSATLVTAGNQTLTATDTVTSSITGSTSVSVAAAAATHLSVSAPGTATAGAALSFTVTALDAFNNTATGYTGTVTFTSTDPLAMLPPNTTLIAGTGSFYATLKTDGSQTLTATDTVTSTITGTSAPITVETGVATHFSLSALANTTAGAAFNLTVTALDAFNNIATGYTGTVQFTSSDTQAVLPPNITLTSGTGTFSVTLKTAGSQSITSTDTRARTITGTTSITVGVGVTSLLSLSAPGSATAGGGFSYTVTAEDAYGNITTGYTGTVHFTSSDNQAVLPPDSTLTAGTGTFSATFVTAGNQTLTATDTTTSSITGRTSVSVAAAAATHLSVSAPGTTNAGAALSFTITALDAFNNTATGYAGTVTFTSTDAQAMLPAESTLTNGVGTFSATFKTTGSQTLTATYTVTHSLTVSTGITVNPGAAVTFGITTTLGSVIAGGSTSATVTALDAFHNVVTTYAGMVHFTSSDPQAVLPVDSTLTSGVGTFSATFKTAGSQSLTATDTTVSSTTGSTIVGVTPAAATHFAVSVPGTATVGVAFQFTVKAQDKFNNTATGYAGTVQFSSSDAQAMLPEDSTLAGGVGTFSATLQTVGAPSVTVTDTMNAALTATQGIVVATSPPLADPPLSVQPVLIGGSPNGTVQVYNYIQSTGIYALQETLTPFGTIPADVRTAVGDVNGDGIPDYIFATGPGTPFEVTVLSGASGNPVLVAPFDPFLPAPPEAQSDLFTAGGFVSAGDFLNNGRDQIVVSPDQQGGPRVAIYDMDGAATAAPQPYTAIGVNTQELNPGSGLTRINNFLSVNSNFRGGARTAVGDLNGDGVPDLAIAAGFGGGPAVLVINGTKVATTNGFTASDDVIGDFFAFNSSLRDGAYLAIGDVLGNGQQDLILGPGAGGPAEVEVLSGAQIVNDGAVAAIANPVALFTPTGLGGSGSGERVAADPTGVGDDVNVVVGAGRNMPGLVKVYPGTNFTSGSTSEPSGGQILSPDNGVTLADGIFVG